MCVFVSDSAIILEKNCIQISPNVWKTSGYDTLNRLEERGVMGLEYDQAGFEHAAYETCP